MSEGSSPKQTIILDTNIIGNIFTKTLGEKTETLIRDLIETGFNIRVSEISYFELLKMFPRSDLDYVIKALEMLPAYEVTLGVLEKASDLYRLCLDKGIPKDQIDTEDYIIGATATLTGSLIYTGDLNDYPRPYFREKGEKVFTYKVKNYTAYKVTAFFAPNIIRIEQDLKIITKKSKLKS